MTWGPKAGVIFGMLFMLFLLSGIETNRSSAFEDELVKGKRQIKTINKALTKQKQKLGIVKKKEKRVLTELDRVERQIVSKKRKLRSIRADLKKLEDKSKAIPPQIHALEKLVNKQEKLLKERLVARYKMGAGGYLKLIFASSSYIPFENRLRSMNAILEYDARLIKDYQKNLALLKEARQRLEQKEKKLTLGRKRIQNQKMELAKKEKQKRRFLRSIKTKKDLYIKAIREYEEASNEIQKLLRDLKQKGSESPPRLKIERRRAFGYWKGRLPFPLKGRISKEFGKKIHPQLNTYVFYKGIGIEAPIGSKVRSVYQGRVIFSGWLKGYGNVLIIDHEDHYYTLFAHLSRSLKVTGERIKSREIIGLVGDSDSFDGAHLYFEIRHNGKPVNPLNWLAMKENRISHRRKK